VSDVDLNLLGALDVLLEEGSVTGAARRLGLSVSAMSRTLTRLRVATGDPLLVRAGRALVPTPHAVVLRDQVRRVTREARAVLQPQGERVEPGSLVRVFTIRASEGFMEFLSVPVVKAVLAVAPGVRLRFVPKPERDVRALREGAIDLEIGFAGVSAPEMRTQFLFRDRMVGVVRIGHPLLSGVTAEDYAGYGHVVTLRVGDEGVDRALGEIGLKRNHTVVVPGYPDAMRIARCSDLVAVVPESCFGNRLVDGGVAGLDRFELPVFGPAFAIAAMWHPRVDADPAQRWLRGVVMDVCRRAYPQRRVE